MFSRVATFLLVSLMIVMMLSSRPCERYAAKKLMLLKPTVTATKNSTATPKPTAKRIVMTKNNKK